MKINRGSMDQILPPQQIKNKKISFSCNLLITNLWKKKASEDICLLHKKS